MKWFSKFFLGTPWFGVMVITAFASIISFFQIDSYRADKHHLNGFWLIAGIVLGLFAIFSLYKVTKTTNGGGGGSSVQ